MKHSDKAILLKDTIEELYSKEGRSFNYISKLLKIDRKVLTNSIKLWGFKEAPPKRRLTPSNEKFLKKHRQKIKAMLDRDSLITDIARELNCNADYLTRTIIPQDDVLSASLSANYSRRRDLHNREAIVQNTIARSSLNYLIDANPNEIWKPILGYSKYEVSNKGRVRKYAASYDKYFEIKAYPNKNTNRLYVAVIADDGTKHNLQVSRLVGYAFVARADDTCTTINHIDGNVLNNNSDNLEWVSQSDNNIHSYKQLNRRKVNFKRYNFSKIVYKDTYEFKSIAALARFMRKSETQVRRYLDFPDKYELKLIE